MDEIEIDNTFLNTVNFDDLNSNRRSNNMYCLTVNTNDTGARLSYDLSFPLSNISSRIEQYNSIDFDKIENLDDLIMVAKAVCKIYNFSVGESNPMYEELKNRGLLIG